MPFIGNPEKKSVIDESLGMELKQIYANREDVVFRLSAPDGAVEFIAYMDPDFPGYQENGVLTWIVRGCGFYFSEDKERPADDYIREALVAWKGLYGLGKCDSIVVKFK